MVSNNKEKNISDVDIVEDSYFKKTITLSFNLAYTIYKGDKKRFEQDIQNYVEGLGYSCTCELTDRNYNSYSRVEIRVNCDDDKEDLTYLSEGLDFEIKVIFIKNDYY